MATIDSISREERIASLRNLIQPIEDRAARGGIQFDTIIKPGRGPRGCDRLGMSATLSGAEIDVTETDLTTPEFAAGHAEYLELWAARLLEVAADLRKPFPAKV